MTVALQVRRLRTRLRWERTSTFALRAGAIAAPLWVAGCVGAGLRVGVLELAGAAAIGAAWGWRGALDAVGAARRVDAGAGDLPNLLACRLIPLLCTFWLTARYTAQVRASISLAEEVAGALARYDLQGCEKKVLLFF